MSESKNVDGLVNMSNWDSNNNDQEKIGAFKHYVPCRLCQEMFHRIRLTQYFCGTCKRGICEGEHGMWYGKGARGVPQCVYCWAKENGYGKP